MEDLSKLPLNEIINYGGRLCMVVKSGDNYDLLVWVKTGTNAGFWEN